MNQQRAQLCDNLVWNINRRLDYSRQISSAGQTMAWDQRTDDFSNIQLCCTVITIVLVLYSTAVIFTEFAFCQLMSPSTVQVFTVWVSFTIWVFFAMWVFFPISDFFYFLFFTQIELCYNLSLVTGWHLSSFKNLFSSSHFEHRHNLSFVTIWVCYRLSFVTIWTLSYLRFYHNLIHVTIWIL